jgi:hypothetical protein
MRSFIKHARGLTGSQDEEVQQRMQDLKQLMDTMDNRACNGVGESAEPLTPEVCNVALQDFCEKPPRRIVSWVGVYHTMLQRMEQRCASESRDYDVWLCSLPLGDQLELFFDTNTIMTLLVDTLGCGPTDGGCLVVAEALKKVFMHGQLVHIHIGGTVQHYGLLTEEGIWDADGRWADPAAWMENLEYTELTCGEPAFGLGHPGETETPRNEELSAEIGRRLLRALQP